MSAFILGTDHIDYLVTAAINLGTGGGYGLYWEDEHGYRVRVGLDNADEFGAMLLAENIASVQYRYNDSEYADLPGPLTTPFASEYRYRRFPITTSAGSTPTKDIAQIMKSIACYEYQTCEHPGWEDSQAKSICDELRRAYVSRLPGYDDADWEVTRPQPTERGVIVYRAV